MYGLRELKSMFCDNRDGWWEVAGRFKKEGMYVYLWLMHVNVLQNQHDIVKHLSFN